MKLRRVRSVRARLTLWNAGVLAVTLLILGGIASVAVARSLTASVDRDLANRVRRHQLFYAHFREEEAKNVATATPPRPPVIASEPLQARNFAKPGMPSLPNDGAPAWDAAQLHDAFDGYYQYSFTQIGGTRARVLSAPLRHDGKIGGAVQAVYVLNDVERAMQNLNRTLLLLIPVGLLASGLGGLLLTSRVLLPVRQVTDAAAHIGASDLSGRLTVVGDDEFSNLARTFNAMLGRLERAWEQQRRFTADASHELRTPLTVIKANASLALSAPDLESGQRRAWEAADHSADFMATIVRDLLLLSTSDAGQIKPDLQRQGLRKTVEIAGATALAEKGTRLTFDNQVPPTLAVCADATLLLRLLVNLLKNAAQHTPDGGRLTVMVGITAAQQVRVSVSDTGTGIAPEHLSHLGERFYRVDAARARKNGGTGLGLAICREIARAHDSDLVIESQVGHGTTVSFQLPLAAGDGVVSGRS